MSTILSLWQRRASLPGNACPLARYEYPFATLVSYEPGRIDLGRARLFGARRFGPSDFRNLPGIANIVLALKSRPPLFERKRQPTDEYLAEEEIYKLDGAKLVAVTKFRQLRWITVNEEWRSR